MGGEFNPTRCIVESAIVKNKAGDTKDITAIIGEFSLSQGINRIAINGILTCLDGVGVLENYGLRGEEELDIVFRSFDFNTKVRLKAQIYRIDGVQRSEDGGSLKYNLYFATRTSYKADLRKVTEAYREKTAGYIAEQIFKKNYSELKSTTPRSDGQELPGSFKSKKYRLAADKERFFYVQGTYGNLDLVVPTFRPSRALELVAAKSYSKESLSNSYRFFENFDGYHFVTDEYLLEMGKANPGMVHDLFYFPVMNKTVEDAEMQRRSIETFTNSRRAHTGQDLYNGAYMNKVVEIDLLQHKVNFRTFNYLEDADYYTGQGKAVVRDDVHTEDFIKDTFLESNAKQFMVFRDYSGPEHIHPEPPLRPSVKTDQYYAEIKANRTAYGEHVKSNTVEIGLKGRLDIQAGHCVNIIMPEINIDSVRMENQTMVGTYLVTGITHIVKEGVCDTKAQLVKYGHVGLIA